MKKSNCLLIFLHCCSYLALAQIDSVNHIKDVVCTAQCAPTDIRKAVHNVKVINEQVIARRGANNLEELLQSEANIRFTSDLVLGSGIQINGVGGENVKILIDGVPVIGRLNSNVDLSQISLQNVVRVEIVQGSLSAVYGSNASGGVINIITRKSQEKKCEIELKSQYESVGIKTLGLQSGYQKNKFLVRLGANYYDFSGYPNDSLRSSLWNPKKQLSGQGVLKYYINDQHTVSYTYNILDENVSNLGDIKRPNFKPYAFDDIYYTFRNDHTINYEGKINRTNLQSTLGFNTFLREKNSYRTDIESGNQQFIAGEQDTSKFKALLWRNTFNHEFNKKYYLLGGTEIYAENAIGAKIQDSTEIRKNFAQIADVAAFLGAKFCLFDSKLKIQPTVRAAYNTKYNAPLTPSLNVLYDFNDHWKTRFGYARGFRAPSLKELYFSFIDINHYIIGSQDIKAETSHNLSLTPSYNKTFGKLEFQTELNLFYNNIKNRIILAQFELLKYQYNNLGEYKTKGAGLTCSFDYNKFVTLKTTAVYTGYYNTARDEQPELPVYLYSPEVNADLSISSENIPLTFNVLYRFTGKTPTYIYAKNGTVEEGRISSWNLLNAMVSTNFWNKRIQLSTGVKNIFDVQNISTQGSINVGHSGVAGQLPVSFGRSYVVRLAIKLYS